MRVLLLAQQAAGSATGEVVLFWVLAAVAVGAAVAMITMRNVVHGALMLVLNFVAIAGLFLVLESPFLAIIQIIVYAGAIMVLFLFVIMLLGVSRDDLLIERHPAIRGGAWLLGAMLVAGAGFVFVGPFTGDQSVCGAAASVAPAAGAVRCEGLAEAIQASPTGSVGFVAERLFTRYTFVFEFAALLLLLAIVAAMVLGGRRPAGRADRSRAEVGESEPLVDHVVPGDTLVPGAAAAPHDPGGSATDGGG
ncbi:MAG: NADH-quinone oxidoreductase subunit J [Actinobacteria bacterium]|nr:NADH-quinone oxidoreductase subunit J [Actinomycetota bacterium]